MEDESEHDEWDYCPSSNETEHRYGDVGRAAGDYAYDLLAELCEPHDVLGYDKTRPSDRRYTWRAADDRTLTTYVGFEWRLKHIRATDDVSAREMESFGLKLHALQQALPFTEAERNWLVDPQGVAVAAQRKHIEKWAAVQEPELICAGVRKVISGRDVVRRWWAWRRETDEFAGQGTLDLARESLRGIVELLHPGELPASYVVLRRFSH
jgi:hypothetical protein